MDAVGDYTQQIDRLLAAGCALFPDQRPSPDRPTPAAVPTDSSQPTPPSPPPAASSLKAAADEAGDRYRDIDTRIAELTEALNRAVTNAVEQAARAGVQARDIRDSVRVQVDAITDAAHTSEGVGQLVSTMDERLGAMAEHIDATREQLRATAQQICQLSVELSAAAATSPRTGR